MATYEAPKEVRTLEKLITDFSYQNGYDMIDVFNDLLRYIIHGFSPGAPPLHNWKYKRQQNLAFWNMLTEWIQIMNRQTREDTDWYDPFGDLFMALSSNKSQQSQGQFFTPVPICDLMVQCLYSDTKTAGGKMNDPTCSSGRLLLAYHVRHLGNYLVGEDISRTCCMMTVCNMVMHGCVGEVVHHDSLSPKDFMDGWFINENLTRSGVPSIRRMTEEEYRANRNIPLSGGLRPVWNKQPGKNETTHISTSYRQR